MSSPAGSGPSGVRSRRSSRRLPVIAVTGAASGLGAAVAARLVAHDGVGKVLGLDDHRGPTEGVTWRVLDVRDPSLATRLDKVDTVVHLAVDTSLDGDRAEQSALNVRGTQAVLTAAAATGVRRVVLLTSAMVYGALPDNEVPLAEDAPLRAVPDGGLLSDWLEVERLAAQAPRSHPGLQVTVVRPATLVGPDVDSVLTRHFEAPRLLVVRDSSPGWQFCHVDDLASALELAAIGAVTGVVTVGCEGWLDQDEVELVSGMRRIELPSSLAFGTAERLHRLGVLPAPASDLQYVVHPWVVPSTRLLEAGWRPAYDNPTALGLLLEQVRGHHALIARRVGRRDATIGAAGAAVAVVGTAALVRAARRKRRG
ncbi:MAG: NAD-dependent epimerase/dehydratase family protein [Sporichthyaceae bacterium]